MQTRRSFLKTTAALGAATLMPRVSLAGSGGNQAATTKRLSDGWEYLNGSLGGPWEVWHSHETAVWAPVAMPHSFNAYDACDPDVPYYRGNGWYRTHVEIANPYVGGRTLLHFEGAGQTAAVFVGDKLAGHHKGGYDEFVLDITELAAASQAAAPEASGKSAKKKAAPVGVPIAVLCDNSRDLDRIPSDLSDFSLYGGLYRHVNLVYVPAVSLEQLHVRTRLASPTSPAEVALLGIFYTGGRPVADPVKVSIEIVDPSGATVHRAEKSVTAAGNESELASCTIARPKLWSPDAPQLYRCTVTVHGPGGEHVCEERFGLRHTELVEHGPFRLNGERLMLRGTHRHEDHAGYANAMPDALVEQEMRLIKQMGANFIRLGHYQQSRRVLELCDELGLLVWEEVPWCRGGVGDEAFREMCREKLRNMIGQHFNHPSVLFWGLGNEDDWPTEYPLVDKEAIRGFFGELNALAHQLDPSRYTSIRRCDFARDVVDAYSPSIWAGWYSGQYTEYQASLERERMRVKHMVHIEWGADSHAGRHSEDPDRVLASVATGHGTDERGLAYLNTGGAARVSRDGDWSETYACNLFDWHLKVQETLDWFMGSAQWVFKDFTTPLRVENPVPRVNQKGVIQRDMRLKESYFVFQSYWSREPMAHIYGHTWPVRWGAAGEQKMVKVYSNCETAELFVNGVSAGVKRRDSQDFPAAGLRWMTPFVAGRNRLRVVAKSGAATVTDEVEFTYQTEVWDKPAALTLVEKGREVREGKPVVTVEATLRDAKGVLCLDARNEVRFSVAGRATMIDNLGTPQGSRLVQMCNGRSEISLLLNGGASDVAVSAEGLPVAFCRVG